MTRDGVLSEGAVIGFDTEAALALSYGTIAGLGPGSLARCAPRAAAAPHDGWLGRIVDPLGRPIDALPPIPRPLRPPGLAQAPLAAPLAAPRAALLRERLGPRVSLGVRALDLFTPCRAGQRLGLFAGSGVGKSTLLGMLSRGAAADIIVLALVGERSREIREFAEDELGTEGLRRGVVIAATADSSPLLRREAVYTACAAAEHFRDQGLHVLLMIDSLTRFCLAAREIAISAGEPPAMRGFPPSVFAELPRVLERAGPGPSGSAGTITGLFTVLVEGDDLNEPVTDAVRGILDGHVVLSRAVAESGRYPAVDILRSLSRSAPGCLTEAEARLAREGRLVLARAAEMADLVRLGAYRPGTDAETDRALAIAPRIEALLTQDRREGFPAVGAPDADPFAALAACLTA
jgi:flagellum-specific ATP synthase